MRGSDALTQWLTDPEVITQPAISVFAVNHMAHRKQDPMAKSRVEYR
jgi:hypothetical protein